MIKKICKNISVIIVGVILIIMAFKVGQCSRGKPSQTTKTIFMTDTLDYEIPDYVEEPGLIFKFTHKSIPPRSKQPVQYKPWMDSVFSAIVLIKRGKEVEMILKRGMIADRYFVDNVPDDFEFHGTPIGYKIIKKRFENPFGWNGITIGTRVYYDRTVVPYLETGIRIQRFNFNIGVDKLSLYADVSWRIW